MILIGKNVSPFVRRVAVTLMELDMPFQRELLSPKKPADKLHLPWREACQAQALAALDELEAWSPAPWFVGDELTQADVTAAVGYTFMAGFDKGVVPTDRYPNLERHRDYCEARPAFQATRPGF